MKLKSLLAIVSCSAIALSISVPTIAETVKDSQIKLEPTGIGNKDYRNKQSTPSIVGSWKSGVNDNEYRHTDPVEIYADFNADGTNNAAFRRKDGDNLSSVSYKYAPTKNENLGAIVHEDNKGRTYLSAIRWISSNEFIITLVKDSHEPHRNGLKRRYVRIQEPVATQLQQQAARTAASQRSSNRNLRLQDELRSVPSRTRGIIDTFRGSGY